MKRRAVLLASAAAAAATAPALAQGPAAKRIGWLDPFAPENPASAEIDRFFFGHALPGLGWVRGRTLEVVARHGLRDASGWDAAARELVEARVDLIVTFNDPLVGAARRATRTIPIVAISGAMVEFGYAQSLARPGGNVTGVVSQSFEFSGRLLALLRDIRPGLQRLGVPALSTDPAFKSWFDTVEAVASPLGIRVIALPLPRVPADIGPMLDTALRERVQALRMWFLPVLSPAVWRQINAWAVEHRVVTTSTLLSRGEAVVGFGPNMAAQASLLAEQIDRVLRGANPAETPIMQPTVWDIVINQKLARAVGWPAPPAVRLQATEVID